MLSETSQTEKEKYCMVSLTYGIKNNVDLIETESRKVVARGWVGGWWVVREIRRGCYKGKLSVIR